jgi:hypothetical protein
MHEMGEEVLLEVEGRDAEVDGDGGADGEEEADDMKCEEEWTVSTS